MGKTDFPQKSNMTTDVLYFNPKRTEPPPSVPSLHGQLNNAVKDLDVACVGADGGCLYFAPLPGKRITERDAVAKQIIDRINEIPEVLEWLQREAITKINLP